VRRLIEDERTWKSLSVLASGIEALFEQMAAIMQDPGEHESFYERAAQSVSAELSDLLDRCTGGPFPDYASFYEKAGDIFSKGYSHRVISEVAAITTRFFSLSQGESSQTSEQKWRDFQKFKLLRAFIDQYMAEPARSVFLHQFEQGRLGHE
jgi:hypothetical protein